MNLDDLMLKALKVGQKTYSPASESHKSLVRKRMLEIYASGERIGKSGIPKGQKSLTPSRKKLGKCGVKYKPSKDAMYYYAPRVVRG